MNKDMKELNDVVDRYDMYGDYALAMMELELLTMSTECTVLLGLISDRIDSIIKASGITCYYNEDVL